jgi:hypothetical protein
MAIYRAVVVGVGGLDGHRTISLERSRRELPGWLGLRAVLLLTMRPYQSSFLITMARDGRHGHAFSF